MDQDLPASVMDHVRPMQQSVQQSNEFGIVQIVGFDYSSNYMLIWEFRQRFLLHARVTLICRQSTRHQGYNKKDTCLGVSALTEGGDRNTGIQQRRESQRVWAKVIWGRPDLPGCFQSGPYSKSSSGSHRSCTAHCIWSSTHRCHNDPGWGSLKSPWPPSDLSVTTGCCPGTWRARHTCQGHRIRGAFPESASKEPGNADFWGDASTWRAPLPR